MRKKAFVFFLSLCMIALMIAPSAVLAAPQETFMTIDAPSILSGNVATIQVSVEDEEGDPVTDGTVTLTILEKDPDDEMHSLITQTLIPDLSGLVQMAVPNLSAQIYQIDAVFTSADLDEYQDSETSDTLDVKMPVKLFEKPTTTQTSYPYGTTLDEIELTGGKCNVAGTFVFKDPDQKLVVGTNYVPVLFVPDDEFYGEKDFNETIAVTIVPATPVLSNVKVSGTVDDGKLVDATITGDAINPTTGKKVAGTFTIKDPDGTIDPDKHTIDVVFNPSHTLHYNSVSAQASLKVNIDQSTATSRTTEVVEQQPVETSSSTIEVIQGDPVEVINQDSQSTVSTPGSSGSATSTGSGSTQTTQSAYDSAATSDTGILDSSFPSSKILGCLAVGITCLTLGLVVFRNKIF